MEDKFVDKIYGLIDKEEYSKAVQLLKVILDENENDMDAKKLLALCEVNMEQYNVARVLLEDIVKFNQEDALIWYYLGCCYDSLGNIPAAKNAYKTVIELRPEYIDAYKSFTIMLVKAEEYELAIEYGKKALELSDDDYTLFYILGTACMAAKNFDDSIYYISKALEIEPNNLQLYNNLGTAYLTIGELDKAFDIYKQALEIDNKDGLTYFNLASILQMQNKHKEACEYFEKAHENEPEDDNYIIAWSLSEVKAGKFKEAIEHYKHLAAVYPQKMTYKYNLACCYQVLGDYEIAISILKQLALLHPKAINILKKLADIYVTVRQYTNAKEIYERMIKQGAASDETYYELSILCIKTQDLERAENMLKKVCSLNKSFAPAHKDLGVIYLNKRLFDYAKIEFETAYNLAPENPSIITEYANYYHAISDFEKADELYQKAIELAPTNYNTLAFSALNKTHLKQNDIAKEQIDIVLANSKESAFLLFIAGRIYFIAKEYERAKEYLVKSFEMEQIPDVQNLLALCYFELGNIEQAKVMFENMLQKTPLNINLQLNLAKCHEKLGENDKALECAEKITETFEDCEEAHEIIRRLS